jgi:RNA polymerase sigma-70 factor, ECF subfamily
MDAAELADALTAIRSELVRYLTRLTGSPEAAEDAAQSTYVRASEASDRAPSDSREVRRWLFRIATNLALDELRRRKRWTLTDVETMRDVAEASPAFVARSAEMAATPEVTTLVREHVDACFGCVVRNLPPQHAAAVLLRELHEFSYDEVAGILGARPAQVKNWIQTGRRTMHDRYASTCALITKTGICHQCTELSDFFQSPGPAALEISDGSVANRLRVLRRLNSTPVGSWHRSLLTLVNSVQGSRPV